MLRNVVVLNDHGYISGGAAQVALSSINALVDRGLVVFFVFGVPPVDISLDRRKVQIVNLGKHELLSNPSRVRAALLGIWDVDSAKKVGEVLNKLDPTETIVHLHTWTKALSASVVREVHRRGFKMVCTLHDYFSVCPNGGLYDYQSRQPCLLEPMSSTCIRSNCDSRSYPQKLWRVARHWVQEKYGLMPTEVCNFISVSDFSARILKNYLPSNARLFRVTNAIDIQRSTSAKPSAAHGFTFVGRLSPEKGADVFAEAAVRAGVVARFVGSGEAEARVRQIYPQAKFSGWQDRAGVIDAIRQSRAVVFPSLWYETQGLVVKEAAALGVPSIVADGCAARDSVVDGVTGLLFRAGDTNDLALKLRMLEDSPNLAEEYGSNAYAQYWSAPCTLARHVDELIDCYQSILRGGTDRDLHA